MKKPDSRVKLDAVSPMIGLAATSFVLAMAVFPGGYDPAMRMMSALGRTEVHLVECPWSLYFFVAGMLFSACGVVLCSFKARLCAWGAWMNALGLVAIALAPEDRSQFLHGVCCTIAAVGGAAMFLRWLRAEPLRLIRGIWAVALVIPSVSLLAGIICHDLKLTAFAPWVPLSQKALILPFAAWLAFLALRGAGRGALVFAAVWLLVPVALALCLLSRPAGPSLDDVISEACDAEKEESVTALPVSGDELAGLAWLERVTGPLDVDEEREWWDIGGSQHGIFAKRYNIAFAGYAAAAIGMRGDVQVRTRAGKVLGNCLRRMICRCCEGLLRR